MKKSNRYIEIKQNILWYIASLVEWIIIPLYLASMGYEFNIDIYTKLRKWQYVTTIYYILASIDIVLFMYLVIIYRKKEQLKLMAIAVFCCLVQIILLISKVKF